MAPRYDLIVVDLDGTLLRPDGTVSEASREAVRRARDAGVDVIIATGRAMVESGHVIEAIEHRGQLITAGGSMRQCATTGWTVDRSAMDHVLVEDITRELLRNDHKVLLLKDPVAAGYDYLAVGPAELDPASRWWFEMLPVSVRSVERIEEDPHPADTVRVGAVASEAELAPIARDLKEALGERVFLQHWSAVTETAATGAGTHLLEAFEPRVGKWTMVERYCAEQSIDPARVAAIGDGLNDVDLVRNAALGVAMGNADPRVRAVAGKVTDTNVRDGVARAIEAILEARW